MLQQFDSSSLLDIHRQQTPMHYAVTSVIVMKVIINRPMTAGRPDLHVQSIVLFHAMTTIVYPTAPSLRRNRYLQLMLMAIASGND
eukprot:scaffold474460_cov16-Prasinocladus_malaysianus.AAC.1